MKQGCDVLKLIIVEEIGLFDCIEKAIPAVGQQNHRKAKVMNGLGGKFNSTTFTSRNQIVQAEKFSFRSKEEINGLLQDEVQKFEKTAQELYVTNFETLKV